MFIARYDSDGAVTLVQQADTIGSYTVTVAGGPPIQDHADPRRQLLAGPAQQRPVTVMGGAGGASLDVGVATVPAGNTSFIAQLPE